MRDKKRRRKSRSARLLLSEAAPCCDSFNSSSAVPPLLLLCSFCAYANELFWALFSGLSHPKMDVIINKREAENV